MEAFNKCFLDKWRYSIGVFVVFKCIEIFRFDLILRSRD